MKFIARNLIFVGVVLPVTILGDLHALKHFEWWVWVIGLDLLVYLHDWGMR